MSQYAVTSAVLGRLTSYLNYLKSLPDPKPENVSSTVIASALGKGNALVRKDLACVSSSGRPRVGYRTEELIIELEGFLGYDDIKKAVLVGAGKLGGALLGYEGFNEYGVDIIAGFDISPGDDINGRPIYPMERFKSFCTENRVKIGVITVPAKHAQEVCDLMMESGIMAIWNFAPTHLEVPRNILVKNENMAGSLVMLSSHLQESRYKNKS
ncbi:MAG: redox-sensing transcriptional repressor Rex [Ruminococcaceae bacterium]|nr:redox-sensing transcriptional repressor Rex [Oscillospiraceae bacterium]